LEICGISLPTVFSGGSKAALSSAYLACLPMEKKRRGSFRENGLRRLIHDSADYWAFGNDSLAGALDLIVLQIFESMWATDSLVASEQHRLDCK